MGEVKVAKFKRLMFWRRQKPVELSPDALRAAIDRLERHDRLNVQELTRIMRDHHLDSRGRKDMAGLLKELDRQLASDGVF